MPPGVEPPGWARPESVLQVLVRPPSEPPGWAQQESVLQVLPGSARPVLALPPSGRLGLVQQALQVWGPRAWT